MGTLSPQCYEKISHAEGLPFRIQFLNPSTTLGRFGKSWSVEKTFTKSQEVKKDASRPEGGEIGPSLCDGSQTFLWVLTTFCWGSIKCKTQWNMKNGDIEIPEEHSMHLGQKKTNKKGESWFVNPTSRNSELFGKEHLYNKSHRPHVLVNWSSAMFLGGGRNVPVGSLVSWTSSKPPSVTKRLYASKLADDRQT